MFWYFIHSCMLDSMCTATQTQSWIWSNISNQQSIEALTYCRVNTPFPKFEIMHRFPRTPWNCEGLIHEGQLSLCKHRLQTAVCFVHFTEVIQSYPGLWEQMIRFVLDLRCPYIFALFPCLSLTLSWNICKNRILLLLFKYFMVTVRHFHDKNSAFEWVNKISACHESMYHVAGNKHILINNGFKTRYTLQPLIQLLEEESRKKNLRDYKQWSNERAISDATDHNWSGPFLHRHVPQNVNKKHACFVSGHR